jgi:hypothetical protein
MWNDSKLAVRSRYELCPNRASVTLTREATTSIVTRGLPRMSPQTQGEVSLNHRWCIPQAPSLEVIVAPTIG